MIMRIQMLMKLRMERGKVNLISTLRNWNTILVKNLWNLLGKRLGYLQGPLLLSATSLEMKLSLGDALDLKTEKTQRLKTLPRKGLLTETTMVMITILTL